LKTWSMRFIGHHHRGRRDSSPKGALQRQWKKMTPLPWLRMATMATRLNVA
jgi:hypothetical protein